MDAQTILAIFTFLTTLYNQVESKLFPPAPVVNEHASVIMRFDNRERLDTTLSGYRIIFMPQDTISAIYVQMQADTVKGK